MSARFDLRGKGYLGLHVESVSLLFILNLSSVVI